MLKNNIEMLFFHSYTNLILKIGNVHNALIRFRKLKKKFSINIIKIISKAK